MRIEQRLQAISSQGQKALIPYLMAGDPDADKTLEWMRVIKDSGADILELGVPFSDPMADGPVIQAASERALAQQMSLRNTLDIVQRFRKEDDELPIVLMSYLNPIEQMGISEFAKAAAAAGVDGVLIVDLPHEEAEKIIPQFEPHGIIMIFLLALTTTPERLATVARIAKGFVYCISLKGVTGSSQLNVKEVAAYVAKVRKATPLPIAIGFGIRDRATAKQMAKVGDAVVVGSAVVDIIHKHGHNPEQCKVELHKFIKDLKQAVT